VGGDAGVDDRDRDVDLRRDPVGLHLCPDSVGLDAVDAGGQALGLDGLERFRLDTDDAWVVGDRGSGPIGHAGGVALQGEAVDALDLGAVTSSVLLRHRTRTAVVEHDQVGPRHDGRGSCPSRLRWGPARN
jgi:hypothetical protein